MKICILGSEAQVLLPLFESDPYDLMAEAAAGQIRSTPRFSDLTAVTVVLASEGYPGETRTGDVISGLAAARSLAGVEIFAAGVGAGTTTDGGRVLNVTGLGTDVDDASTRVRGGGPDRLAGHAVPPGHRASRARGRRRRPSGMTCGNVPDQ